MLSKMFKNERKPIPLATFAQDVARRKALSRITELPRISEERRTDSKKALLKAVHATGKSWQGEVVAVIGTLKILAQVSIEWQIE